MSFYEILPFSVDVQELKNYIQKEVIPIGDPVYSTNDRNEFGGYSILSRTGHWQDGWEIGTVGAPGYTLLDPKRINFKAVKFLNLAHYFEHKNPTEICSGPIKELIDNVTELGFYPRRARITLLKPNSQTIPHSDGNGNYMCRLHVPLITHEKCVHKCEGINLHMPADGKTYILKVNVLHQVFNDSPINRYHIIMDCWDTKGITQNFRYPWNIKKLEEEAEIYRKTVDSITLNDQEILHFEKLKKQIFLNR